MWVLILVKEAWKWFVWLEKKKSRGEMEMSNILIREFNEQEVDTVTKIKLQAFESKYKTVFNWDDKQLKKIIKFFILKMRYTKIIVAEENGELVGFIALESKQFIEGKKRSPYFLCIKKFGFFQTFKYFLSAFSVEFSNLKDDELYISQIAVSEKGRGKGIGSLLMEAGERECYKIKEIFRFTLFVMNENERAHKLYNSLGFKDVEEVKIPLMKQLTGFSSAIYMEKRLNKS